MQKVQQRMVARFDVIRFMGVGFFPVGESGFFQA